MYVRAVLMTGAAMLVLLSGNRPASAALNYTYPSTVGHYYLFANDGGVSSKLAGATLKLQGNDFTASCLGVFDNQACVTLTQSGTSTPYPPAQLPLDITNETELQAAFAVAENIKVVGTISWCNNMSGVGLGCTRVGERNIIIRQSASSSAGVLAHEFGHAQGLNYENYSCVDYVMFFANSGNYNILTSAEALTFVTPAGQFFNGPECVPPPVSASTSFFVPESGSYSSPAVGTNATTFFRGCPNNDGTASYPSAARIRVVVKDILDSPISGVAASDVYLLFNGGTPAQGFGGIGADSIIANSAFNYNPPCPDVRRVQADGPTNSAGVTYITFTGAGGTRNPLRKWGHYDSEIPVYVAGTKLDGRLTSGSPIGSYTLRLKSYDWTGGTQSYPYNIGEVVTGEDWNGVVGSLNGSTGPFEYWKDFDSQNGVDPSDFNLVTGHYGHHCKYPVNDP